MKEPNLSIDHIARCVEIWFVLETLRRHLAAWAFGKISSDELRNLWRESYPENYQVTDESWPDFLDNADAIRDEVRMQILGKLAE